MAEQYKNWTQDKEPDHITAREIRFFTMYLNNEKEWNRYSRNPSKLFESVNFERIDLEVAQQQAAGIDEATRMYDLQLEEIEYLRNYEPKMMGERAGNGDMYVTDDDMIGVINYLVQTKDKGPRSDEKSETLSKIKNLLEKWM